MIGVINVCRDHFGSFPFTHAYPPKRWFFQYKNEEIFEAENTDVFKKCITMNWTSKAINCISLYITTYN